MNANGQLATTPVFREKQVSLNNSGEFKSVTSTKANHNRKAIYIRPHSEMIRIFGTGESFKLLSLYPRKNLLVSKVCVGKREHPSQKFV